MCSYILFPFQICQPVAYTLYQLNCLLNYVVKPVVTIPPMSQVSKTATNVTFTCVANAHPRAVIQWRFNGNELRNSLDSDGSRYYITNEIEGYCLVIDPISQCETSSTLEIVNTQLADS